MNKTYSNFMNERTIERRSHRVHVKTNDKKFVPSEEVLDREANKKYFGSEYKKIKTCTSCYVKHNGDCY